MDHYVITIARGFGSGGKEIGSKLAARLGIPCYESQILKMASDESGLNEALFSQVDEKLNVEGRVRSYLRRVPFEKVATPSMKEFTSDINLFNIQSQIIRHRQRQMCIRDSLYYYWKVCGLRAEKVSQCAECLYRSTPQCLRKFHYE